MEGNWQHGSNPLIRWLSEKADVRVVTADAVWRGRLLGWSAEWIALSEVAAVLHPDGELIVPWAAIIECQREWREQK